jgi:ankyrin repeat protein
LHHAALHGFDKILSILIKYKADVDQVDLNGQTALHFAAKYNRVSTFWLLLEYGLNILVMDKNGKTPVDLCVLSCNDVFFSIFGLNKKE